MNRPSVKYFCNLDYDPFLFMEDNNKIYGWTLSILEFKETSVHLLFPVWMETDLITRHSQIGWWPCGMRQRVRTASLRCAKCRLIIDIWRPAEFIKENPEFLAKPNMIDFLSNDGGNTYNLCHFWSNFEVRSISISIFLTISWNWAGIRPLIALLPTTTMFPTDCQSRFLAQWHLQSILWSSW